MVTRVKVAEFGIIQKGLANGVVTFYKANADGSNSGEKTLIYAEPTGLNIIENPQTLDECGKLRVDCYVDTDVVASITGINDRTMRRLKDIKQNPFEYSLPVTTTNFYFSNITGSNESALLAAQQAIEAQQATSSAEAIVLQARDDVEANQTNALASEINAQNFANQAAQSASEGLYNNIVDIEFSDSPFTPTLAQEGTLFRCDPGAGNIVINLSPLSTYGSDVKFAFVKTDGSNNTVTINRGGGDTINGQNSLTLDIQFESNYLVGDVSSNTWLKTVQSGDVIDRSITGLKIALMTILGENIASNTISYAKLLTSSFANLADIVAGTANKLVNATTLKLFAEDYIKPKVSPAITIDATQEHVFAHGFNSAPIEFGFYLECITASDTFAVGDIIVPNGYRERPNIPTSQIDGGSMAYSNDTNVIVRLGRDFIQMVGPTGLFYGSLGPSNYNNFKLRIWAKKGL